MINIWFGDSAKGIMWDIDEWFNTYGNKYLSTDFSRRVIGEIDKCEYISDKVVKSSVMGVIPSEYLSTGSKAAIMLMYSDNEAEAHFIGDNVIPFIREIGLKKDITLVAGYFFMIYPDRTLTYPVKVLNTGKVVYNIEDYYDEYDKSIDKGDYEHYAVYTGKK